MKYKLVDTDQIFVDSTHVKACANSKKCGNESLMNKLFGMKMN